MPVYVDNDEDSKGHQRFTWKARVAAVSPRYILQRMLLSLWQPAHRILIIAGNCLLTNCRPEDTTRRLVLINREVGCTVQRCQLHVLKMHYFAFRVVNDIFWFINVGIMGENNTLMS